MLSDAQAMVEALSGEFACYADQSIAELAHLTKALHPATAGHPAALRQIYRISHEIKGQATTFGFDLLTSIGHSLCCLISNADADTPAFRHAIDTHVNAFRLARRRDVCGDGGTIGRKLMAQLNRAADAALNPHLPHPPERPGGAGAT